MSGSSEGQIEEQTGKDTTVSKGTQRFDKYGGRQQTHLDTERMTPTYRRTVVQEQRERERDRETDREGGEREREKQKHRERERQTKIEEDREIETERERETGTQRTSSNNWSTNKRDLQCRASWKITAQLLIN